MEFDGFAYKKKKKYGGSSVLFTPFLRSQPYGPCYLYIKDCLRAHLILFLFNFRVSNEILCIRVVLVLVVYWKRDRCCKEIVSIHIQIERRKKSPSPLITPETNKSLTFPSCCFALSGLSVRLDEGNRQRIRVRVFIFTSL